MNKIFLSILLLFFYGCNLNMKKYESTKCKLSLKKTTAWINLMPKLSSKKDTTVIIKIDLLKENCTFKITPKEIKVFFKNRVCNVKNIKEIEETKKDIKLTIRECKVAIGDESLKFELVLEDNNHNNYMINSKNIRIRKIY